MLAAPPGRRRRVAAAALVFAVAAGCSATARGSGTPPAVAAAGAGGVAGVAGGGGDLARQVLITLPEASRRSWERTSRQLEVAYRLRTSGSWSMHALGVRCVVFDVRRGASVEQVVARLAADRRVESAQPIYAFEVLTGGDPYLSLQRGAAALGLESVHRWATGEGVKVAVIDTGVDVRHPDLAARIARAGNFVAGDEGDFSRDVHGTAVAGVLAASADNGVGIVGVAPGAELFALKACRPRGAGSAAAWCDSFSLAKALDFALAGGARVLNLSLAGPRDPLMARLIAAALDRGVVVVAAARNAAAGADEGFPASLAGVIAVRSNGPPGRPPSEGDPTDGGRVVLAPGVDVLTTVPGGGYDFFSGASMAAAQVSGLAALLLERDPALSPARIAGLLRDTSRIPVGEDRDPAGGGGVATRAAEVDACGALSALLGVSACAGAPPDR